MRKGILTRIRRTLIEGRYEFTNHLLEEAAADSLTTDAVLQVLRRGDLDSVYTEDPRGPRDVVRGEVRRLKVDVVCRFRRDGVVLMISTTYVVTA